MSDSPLKRALKAIERLERRVHELETRRAEPIAIVGVGCRFPRNATSPESFWRQLVAGEDSVSVVPPDRWDIDALYDPDPDAPGKMSTRWGAFLDGIDRFDPAFFGITPREASSLDPQQRLLLECAWEALERAGCPPETLQGQPVGVWVGIINDDYGDLQLADGGVREIDAYFGSGNSSSVAAGRLAYVFGLAGPAVSVDTACSSSLVALHLACQSLHTGESRMALAGGVNVTLSPEGTIALSRYKMMALDGRCKTFDERADGYVRGEGCAVLALKRLSDARADGDPIFAVIRATAVNQDGASSGLTAPNGPAQEAVLRAALEAGGVAPEQVGYVEAHGTGTSLGDPIEIQALDAVLGRGRTEPLVVGSVKTNVGHLESAAGMAGLVKAALAVRHRRIPPHLHLERPNPFIPWDRVQIDVPREARDWPADTLPIAGVSSFGFSGTNAHVLVEAPPEETPASTGERDRDRHVLCLSAREPAALTQLAERVAAEIAGVEADGLGDVCYSLGAGRTHHPHRLAVVASDGDAARAALDAWREGEPPSGVVADRVRPGDPPRVAFLFTGQGAQYAGMASGLYEREPVFRAALDRCADGLAGELEQPLLDVLFGDAADSPIDRTAFTQPALFAVEWAVAELWESWGVRPAAMLGHSVGELVAAQRAGVFSLEDGLLLIAERARRMNALPEGGAMAAAFTDESTALAAIDGDPRVAVAAINGPENTVVSGDEDAVAAVLERLAERGVKARRLVVSHAFHSPRMDPMLEAFERFAAGLALSPPVRRLGSNRTGEVAGAELSRPGYWSGHVREAVRFADGVRTLDELDCEIWLEVGPQPTLIGMAQRCLPDASARTWLPTLRRKREDGQMLADALAVLETRGVPIDWRAVDAGRHRRQVALPTYPFQKSRHWFRESGTPTVSGSSIGASQPPREAALHPLLERRLRSALPTAQFEGEVDPGRLGFVRDHRIHGIALLPATAYVECAHAAAEQLDGAAGALEALTIEAPLVFPGDAPRTIQVSVEPAQDGARALAFWAAEGGEVWKRHATARLVSPRPVEAAELSTVRAACTVQVEPAEHERRLRERGFTFGPTMRALGRLWRGEGEALAEVRLPEGADRRGYRVPPALLDACLQFFWAVLPDADADATFLPLAFGRIQIDRALEDAAWSHARLLEAERDDGGATTAFKGEVTLFDGEERPVGRIESIAFRRGDRDALLRLAQPPMSDWFYETAWRDAPAVDLPATVTPPAVSLTAPSTLGARLDASHDALADRFGLDAHAGLVRGLGTLTAAYLVRALGDLGVSLQVGERLGVGGLIDSAGVLEKYRRELARLLQILEEDGILAPAGADEWTVAQAPATTDPDALVPALQERYPDSRAQVEVTARCGRELAGLLRGQADPLAMIFPGGKLDLAERLYRGTPEARVYNTLIRDAILTVVDELPDGERLRCVELGAGTGGVTSFIVPALPADRTAEYRFTDLSPVFLNRAREAFAEHPFMDYGICDVSHAPSDQGLEEGSYHVAIAVNMIHATPDLRVSLANVRRLLRPGGLLILMEGTGPDRWVDVTFGLTDGWWAFTDLDVRRDYPLIDRERWRALLGEVGFEDATTSPPAHDRSFQAIVMARRPAAETAVAAADGPVHLLLEDDGGVASVTAATLVAQGRRVVRVSAGEGFGRTDRDAFVVDPLAPDQLSQVLAALAEEGVDRLEGATDARPLDARLPGEGPLAPIERRVTGGVVALVRALATGGLPVGSLTLATCGAQPADGGPLDAAAATVWGIARVIDLEQAELRCRRVDLDPAAAVAERGVALAEECLASDRETLVARRDGGRRVGRLSRSRVEEPTDADPRVPTRLTHPGTGVLDDLTRVEVERRPPAPGEVEIEVAASGLSFRDVMNALAMRDDPDPLGAECTGVVTCVGSDVEGFEPGDRVVALTAGAFDTYVHVDRRLVVPLPSCLSFEQGATLGTAFTTAWHALVDVAELSAGETVLIHAAAGGVGLAAVQIAQQRGARVLATAGSAPKRAALEALGVDTVLDSRSASFTEGVLAATDGRGADVVLNSLSGELIGAGVAALAERGRFLEIGKRDPWTRERFSAERPSARYDIVDLAARTAVEPEFMGRLLGGVVRRVAAGELRPLPHRAFELERTIDAFRAMSQARQIGKLVVRHPKAAELRIREDAGYLITGGLNGLGLLTAAWLVDHGARHLLLVSRSEPGDEADAAIRGWEARGVRVHTAAVDVADAAALAEALDRFERAAPPLGGIFHAAGLLRDAVLLNQDWDHFEPVFRAKVEGAWNLHRLAGDRPLDHFVSFASTSGVLGAAGQANHAAANAFLDVLAHQRRRRGLAAQSIDWGVWTRVGSAAAKGADARIVAQGASPIAPDQGLEALERVLRDGRPQIAVVPVHWKRFLPEFVGADPAPYWAEVGEAGPATAPGEDPRRAGAVAESPAEAGGPTSEPADAWLERVRAAPAARRRELLVERVSGDVVTVIGLSAGSVDPEQPLSEIGLDSLMAVELRNRMGATFGLADALPATLVFDYPTVDALAAFVDERLGGTTTAPDETAGAADDDTDDGPVDGDDLLSAIEGMSDDEVDSILKD